MSEKLDLTIISSLVDATLHTLDDALQPAANRMLKLQEVKGEMETTIGIMSTTHCRYHAFQRRVAKPLHTSLKDTFKTSSILKMLCHLSAF